MVSVELVERNTGLYLILVMVCMQAGLRCRIACTEVKMMEVHSQIHIKTLIYTKSHMKMENSRAEKAIKERFALLTKGRSPAEFERMKGMVDRLFDKRTLSFEIGLGNAVTYLFDLPHREGLRPEWLGLVKMINNVLIVRGYRYGEYTSQEHHIMGSTPPDVCAASPYVPTGIVFGELKLEEAREARRLTAIFHACHDAYKTLKGVDYFAALEPLDDSGKTTRDPRLVDVKIFSNALREGVPLEIAYERADMHAKISERMPHPHKA